MITHAASIPIHKLRSASSRGIVSANGSLLMAVVCSHIGASGILKSTNGLGWKRIYRGVSFTGMAAGRNGVWLLRHDKLCFSADGGRRVERTALEPHGPLYCVVEDDGRRAWAAGCSGIAYKSTPYGKFDRVKLPTQSCVRAAVQTSFGVMFLCESGELLLGSASSPFRTVLDAPGRLWDACETREGAVVVVGKGKAKSGRCSGILYRTEDFRKVDVTSFDLEPQSVRMMHDGRIIVGCARGTIMASDDDGRSFRKVICPPVTRGGFSVLASHGDCMVATGPEQVILRLT